MSENSSFQVIFGTGQLGQAVARELVKRGARVRMVNRSGSTPRGVPAGVEVTGADLYDPQSVRRVTQGAQMVFHTAQPPYHQWPEQFPKLQASIIAGLSGGGARLVLGDNLYMYGPVDGPIHEGLPYAAATRKGSTRARMAEALLEAHHKGQLQAVLGRGSDFFGPGVRGSIAGASIFGALAQGKAANVLGSPDLPHTYTFIEDFARALVVLSQHAEAYGQAWHVPNAETVTTRRFVELAAEALGAPAKMMVAGPLMMRGLGLFIPAVREMVELAYEVTQPYIVDDRKYRQCFGDGSTPLAEAVRQTAAWFKSNEAQNSRTANRPGA